MGRNVQTQTLVIARSAPPAKRFRVAERPSVKHVWESVSARWDAIQITPWQKVAFFGTMAYPAYESATRIVDALGADPLKLEIGLSLGAVVVGLNGLHDVAKHHNRPWVAHPGKTMMLAGMALALADVVRHMPNAAAFTALSDFCLGAGFMATVMTIERLVNDRTGAVTNRALRILLHVLAAFVYFLCGVEDVFGIGSWLLRTC
jgi:hypothetical protein